MAISKKQKIANIMLTMTYEEFVEFADELVEMQTSLKEDGDEGWRPDETYGDHGLMHMLYCWAESCDD